MQGVRIGELLVDQGMLDETQVAHILKVQRASNRPFGDLAERLFGVSAQAVEEAWVEQYLRTTGLVDLDETEIDRNCLRAVTSRQAWQFHLHPLDRDGDEVRIATTSDNLVRALNFTSHTLEEPVYLVIADRAQLREYLMNHYPVPDHIARYAATM